MSYVNAQNDEICDILEAGLFEQLGDRVRIRTLVRRPYDYWSSCPLEELSVELDDGRRMNVLFKDLSPGAMPETTRKSRDQWMYDPAREISVYSKLLCKWPSCSARYFGSKLDFEQERFWLFLEKVEGRELYKVAEFAVWEEAARWLASFHRRTIDVSNPREFRLFEWDRDCYQRCIERAETLHRVKAMQGDGKVGGFDRIAAAYKDTVEQLLSRPNSFLHGEFYASNVLIVEDEAGYRVCPVDWETAAWGPPLVDLAALIAGRWSEEQRAALINAYWCSLDCHEQNSWGTEQMFQSSLAGCRLHLAIQMLGRPPEWEPPVEHRHDWHFEAMELATSICQYYG